MKPKDIFNIVKTYKRPRAEKFDGYAIKYPIVESNQYILEKGKELIAQFTAKKIEIIEIQNQRKEEQLIRRIREDFETKTKREKEDAELESLEQAEKFELILGQKELSSKLKQLNDN